MAQRPKMERETAESETSSSPATYQCIVCQMTTVSLSCLHRHQTYQHTSEELSLSTIGLQCSLINNVHSNNRIVYDNSWLCDPLKQAEFYTVSANILNNNNPNNCTPVDYVIEKHDRNFKEENNIDVANEQKIRDFDTRIDHNYGQMANSPPESPKNKMQNPKYRSIGTETNHAEFLEEVNHPETSLALCTETERIITYLEEVMQVEEVYTIGAELNCNHKSSEDVTEAEEGKAADPVHNDDFYSPENEIQVKVSKDIHGRVAAKEIKVAESKVIGPEAISISESAEKETTVREFKVPEARSILKPTDKERKSDKLKFVGPKTDHIFKSAEKDISVEKSKVIDVAAVSISKSEEKGVRVGDLKVINPGADSIMKSEKKAINVVRAETDPFANCIENLCIDLEKIKNKPQKRKRAREPARNPAPRKAKAAAKPRAPRKKAKTSDFVPQNNTAEQEVDHQTEIFMKNDFTSVDYTDLNSNNQKTKNSIEPPKKRVKFADSVPGNITISQEDDQDMRIPVKNCSVSKNYTEVNLNNQKTEDSVELSKKKVKTLNSVVENTTIMQDADQESKFPTKKRFASIKHTELSLESQKSDYSVELPRKKAKTSKSVTDNTTTMLEAEKVTEILPQNDFASINYTELNLPRQRTGNSVEKIFSEDDIVEAQLKALFQQQTETQETEISMIDSSGNSHWIDYHVTKMEPPIPDEDDLAHENFIQQYVDTCKAEIPAEIPVQIKSEQQEFPGDEVNDPRNSEHSEDSVIAALPSTYTFPWYPPDINDYSILVLDPEAHQLVWTEVAIVDEKNTLQGENSPETVVLPELTEADLRDNEICESMTISSDSRTKEISGNLPRSQAKGNATKIKKKPRTNFVLRPRKTAGKKLL